MFEACRLDEANQVRRYRNSHLMTTAQQLEADRSAWLDIATGAMDGDRKSHWRRIRRLVRKVFVFRRLSGLERRTPD
jgi:hypothetical protein